MQYSFKLDLAEKRRKAKVKVCEERIEGLLRDFANLLEVCLSGEGLLKPIDVSISIIKEDVNEPIVVSIASEEEYCTEIEKHFKDTSFEQVLDLFKKALENDGLEYDYCYNVSNENEENSNSKENEISDPEEETELFARISFRI